MVIQKHLICLLERMRLSAYFVYERTDICVPSYIELLFPQHERV